MIRTRTTNFDRTQRARERDQRRLVVEVVMMLQVAKTKSTTTMAQRTHLSWGHCCAARAHQKRSMLEGAQRPSRMARCVQLWTALRTAPSTLCDELGRETKIVV